jgi:hypothetical protein
LWRADGNAAKVSRPIKQRWAADLHVFFVDPQ